MLRRSPMFPKRRQPRLPRGRRLRIDSFLLALVLVLAWMAAQMFGGAGGDAVVEHPAQPGDASAPVAQETLAPALSCEGMPETGEPVRFLMQNVQNYFVAGEQRSRYVTQPKSEAAKEALVQEMVRLQPDVVGLVEIGGPLAMQDLRKRLERAGLSFPYFRVLVRQGEDRALGLLSRLPIVADESRAEMPLYGQHRRTMLRGILDVTVQAEDGRLFRLMGAHLKSRVGDDPAAAAALRNKEAYTLAMHVQEVQNRCPKMPLLVFGDCNDTPETPAVQILLRGRSEASSLCRLTPKDARGEEWTHFYRQGKSYYAFDHLMANKVLRKRLGANPACGIVSPEKAKGSDHRALWVELR